MPNCLTIRSYSKQKHHHSHDYHQLVLPVEGAIAIRVADFQGKVTVGECVVIRAGEEHQFSAEEAARFIVADMDILPTNMTLAAYSVFSITPPLLSYLFYVKAQLEFQVDGAMEQALLNMFYQLLERQTFHGRHDQRIHLVQSYIADHLAEHLTLDELAAIAYLSPTQFKKRFKQETGMTTFQYITQQRMLKAKALLTHTDLPVHRIEESVGYQDLSAFSRRFSVHFGLSPRALTR